VGHTDSQGDEAKNLDLSKRRAAALRDALVERFEIDPERIVVEGMGSEEPIASNRTARGRNANRRVEVLVAR
jgi:outer membrane protein OmpA-like peptidoglycan-associated protein